MVLRPVDNFAALAWWRQHDDFPGLPWHFSGQELPNNDSAQRVGDEMDRLVCRNFIDFLPDPGDEFPHRFAG